MLDNFSYSQIPGHGFDDFFGSQSEKVININATNSLLVKVINKTYSFLCCVKISLADRYVNSTEHFPKF